MNAIPLDKLQPIGLDELNSDASLLTRKDRKYIMPVSMVRSLVEQDDLRVLEIDGLRSFRYESVYFDTPERVSYLAAAHKRRRRFKVRTRSYLDSGLCSLEVKTRERRGLTEKHRLSHNIGKRFVPDRGRPRVHRWVRYDRPASRATGAGADHPVSAHHAARAELDEPDHHRYRSRV